MKKGTIAAVSEASRSLNIACKATCCQWPAALPPARQSRGRPASETMTIPIALTIAGSDGSAGAGIQADLKTFAAFGVYGASVITALTAQNTLGVRGIHRVPAEFVSAQIDAVFSDLDVKALKIGMVAQAPVIDAIVAALRDGPRRR